MRAEKRFDFRVTVPWIFTMVKSLTYQCLNVVEAYNIVHFKCAHKRK